LQAASADILDHHAVLEADHVVCDLDDLGDRWVEKINVVPSSWLSLFMSSMIDFARL